MASRTRRPVWCATMTAMGKGRGYTLHRCQGADLRVERAARSTHGHRGWVVSAVNIASGARCQHVMALVEGTLTAVADGDEVRLYVDRDLVASGSPAVGAEPPPR